MSRKWHRDRFTYSANCVELICNVCERVYWMPPSKVSNNLRCSTECSSAYKLALKKAREKKCKTCNKQFIPRKRQLDFGQGVFCSQKCNTSGAIQFKKMAGRIGEKSPKWRGGRMAAISRRRAAKKGSFGTHTLSDVLNLLKLQRGKCAICKSSIKNKYHIDHVIPISRGGDDGKLNLQLLCPSCNWKKSSKDPILFMQERGFLL